MLNFLFVYPPSTDPTTPPLSLARIKGALEHCCGGKVQARFLDENRRFSRYVLDLAISGALREWLKEINARQAPEQFRKYIKTMFQVAEHISEDLLKALGVLKIPGLFFDILKYTRAYDTVIKAFDLYSLPFYPAYVGYATARFAFDIRKSEEVRKALSSPLYNPYLNYFEERVRQIDVPDVLGISIVYSSQLVPALTLSREIRKRYADTLIIFGGPCAYALKTTLEEKFADLVNAVIPGDAEAFFRYLSEKESAIKERTNFLNTARTYGKGPIQKWVSRPDQNMDYSWVCLDDYLLPEPVICIDVTRGCYYRRCVFCAYGYHGRGYSTMGPEELALLIRRFKRRIGASRFFFSVDVIDPAFLESFTKGLEGSGLDISYCFDARLERKFADPLFVERLFASGCHAISFGMESACQQTLSAMRKGTKAELFSAILKNLYDHQIHVQLHLIHGFPGEYPEEIEQTIKFLKENEKTIATVGASSYALLKSSEMAAKPGQYGIKDISNPGDLSLDYDFHRDRDLRYPSFEEFRRMIFEMFPAVGRLTGSTTDYLLYASRYRPKEMKELLRSAVRIL